MSVLRNHPIFCDLEPEALDQLCRYAKPSTLKRGAAIFSKGDPGNGLFAVIRFADDFQARVGFDDLPEPLTKDRMVVGNE